MVKEKITVAAVVVTYNRLELLKQCIDSIRNQSRRPDEIFVINNSSTDGTLEWLNNQTDFTVITQENSGSAGGQYTGIKTAYEKGYDWIWCLDCDIIADKYALITLLSCDEASLESTGFLTSTISYRDGNLAYANIPELGRPYDVLNAIYKLGAIPVISASFGSLLIRRDIIRRVGFPIKEFFIWGDDAEFTLRIIYHRYKGFMILTSKAEHKSDYNIENTFEPISTSDPKLFYGIRNLVFVSILRNKITHNSKLRGMVSGLGFVKKVYNQLSNRPHLSRIYVLFRLFSLYLKGIFFRPKPEYPLN